MNSTVWILILISLITGLVGAWFMSRYAYRFGLLDIPNDRSSHVLPTPRGGGVGIMVAFAVTSAVIPLPLSVWLPAISLAVVSFFDDRLGLTPARRMAFQFAAALVATIFVIIPGESGSLLTQIRPTVPDIFPSLALCLLLSVYIVGTANFYNFMDGINGIAGITGVVGFVLLGVFGRLYSGSHAIADSALYISFACIGFLPMNIPRARVFMGDVGSILLGFVFALYVVLLARDVSDFLILAGFLSTFYADALTTLVIRWRAGEKLSKAHRRHLYQLFANQMHVTHWKVSSGYGLVQLAIGIVLLWLRPFGGLAVAAFELAMVVVWLLLMIRVRKAVEA